MKGIVFAGCSFTWGQGLYYYSKLDTLREPLPNAYRPDYVTPAHRRFMYSFRWPRLVANHFKTFEVVQLQNGGSEDSSLGFIKQVFNITSDNKHYINENFSYSEIEYVIIQTSQPNRNNYQYNHKGKDREFGVNNVGDKLDFYEWLIEDKKWTIDEWYQHLVYTEYHKIKDMMQFLEDKGVKTKILCWEPDYLHLIQSDEWTNERFIKLYYGDKQYESIRVMMNENKGLTINEDVDFFETPPQDHHPSLLCHEVIAKSVIKSLYPEQINVFPNMDNSKLINTLYRFESPENLKLPTNDNKPKLI